MAKEVRYTITRDQKPTEAQIKMMQEGRKRQDELLAQGRKNEVFDEDCPEIDPETTPERYAAMLKAVGERNRRIAERKRA